MTIRPATVGDAAAIQRVRVAGWRGGYAGVVLASVLAGLSTAVPEHLTRRLAAPPPSCALLVAEVDGRVRGFVNCGPYRHDQDADRRDPAEGGEIYAIYVDPPAWGDGLGTALLTEALAHLRRERLCPVRLWVLADNPRARRFYERHGFTPDGTREPYRFADGTVLTELRYRRD